MQIKNVFGVTVAPENTVHLGAMRVLLRDGSVVELSTKHFKKDGSLKKKAVEWLRSLRTELATEV